MTNVPSNRCPVGRSVATVVTAVLLATMVAVVASTPAGAQAPPPADVAATCGDLAVMAIPEGPFAIEAAESLRSRGAPNPPGIEAALDVIVAAADFETPSPPLADVDAALATLNDYYGGSCAGLDRCAFILQIAGNDASVAAEAAHLLRRIETPSPPGIDAALALIAGDVAESPFHTDVAEARAQVLDYYPCGVDATGTAGAAGGSEGDPTAGSGGGGGGGALALTGSSTTLLGAIGAALVALGALAQVVRRRLLPDAV